MVIDEYTDIKKVLDVMQESSTNMDYIAAKVKANRVLAIQEMARIWGMSEMLTTAVINSLFPIKN